MHGLKTIVKKELSDHFSSYRFTIIFALIAMVSLITAYVAGLNIRTELQGIVKPRFIFLMLFTSTGTLFSLVQFVALFGPLVGLILGFDTINRERNEGTLSKLLSQPIYRDTVINGKFLAGAYPGAPVKAKQYAKVAQEMAEYASLTPSQMMKKVKELEKQMYKHAENLEFEEAAKVRDKLRHLRGEGLVA
mgnify:CR=1 FL=1